MPYSCAIGIKSHKRSNNDCWDLGAEGRENKILTGGVGGGWRTRARSSVSQQLESCWCGGSTGTQPEIRGRVAGFESRESFSVAGLVGDGSSLSGYGIPSHIS